MASNDQHSDGADDRNDLELPGIDMSTFEQILEMDDDDSREFSKSIVYGFFDQAEETFTTMDTALESQNLDELYRLGHFLKGSSATLGLTKVKDSCEKIQRYGKKENLDGSILDDEQLCLSNITETLKVLKVDYNEAKEALDKFLGGPE